MSPPDSLMVTIGSERFRARLRHDLAPRSCGCLLGLLPYARKIIHARWSGEALWSPLGETFPPGLHLPAENPRDQPAPGEILLYAGAQSEPELLVPYGVSRFACKAGTLQGNPILRIEERLERLAELGRQVLWSGAQELRIEVSP